MHCEFIEDVNDPKTRGVIKVFNSFALSYSSARLSRHKIAEPLRIEFHSQEDQFQEDPPIAMMTNNRTMAEMLRAPTEGYEEAIVVPPILVEQFELKHSLINMMTSEQFFGLEKDNPHDHIR
nr:reverse transcriptase domain-containing protein [Tanacetum cinerariifolium]